MASATINYSGSVAGVNISSSKTKEAVGGISLVETLGAAIAGTLSTRTSAHAGVLTLATGHGMQVNDVIDIGFDVSGIPSAEISTHGTVTVVDGDDVTFSGCGGVDLPAEDAVVVARVRGTLQLSIDGDDIVLMFTGCANRGIVIFTDTDDDEYQYRVSNAFPVFFDADSGETNPFAGVTLASVTINNLGATAADMRIGILHNAAI